MLQQLVLYSKDRIYSGYKKINTRTTYVVISKGLDCEGLEAEGLPVTFADAEFTFNTLAWALALGWTSSLSSFSASISNCRWGNFTGFLNHRVDFQLNCDSGSSTSKGRIIKSWDREGLLVSSWDWCITDGAVLQHCRHRSSRRSELLVHQSTTIRA